MHIYNPSGVTVFRRAIQPWIKTCFVLEIHIQPVSLVYSEPKLTLEGNENRRWAISIPKRLYLSKETGNKKRLDTFVKM